jgi:protein MpaA
MRMKFWLVTTSGISFLLAIIIFAQLRQSSLGTWLTSPVAVSGIGCQQSLVIGESVTGQEIQACQIAGSTVDSNNAVLVIGTIHGDEPDGIRVVDELLTERVPEGTEIWVIRDGNPDGSELHTRRNANKVDINRNFPIKWLASDPSLRTYSGPSPASEPETIALMNAVQKIKPTRIVVFHQPYDQIDCPPERTTQISDRLSALTGYRSECIPGEKSGSVTNSYTGTFTIWVNNTFPKATAITFELGPTTMDDRIKTISKALHILAADNTYLP